MNIVGFVFLGLIAIVVLIGIGLTIRSLPDIARYLRIRRM
jgi:hypothetical protein